MKSLWVISFILSLVLFSSWSFASVSVQELKANNLLTGKPEDIKVSQAKKGLVVVFLSAKCPCSNSHVAELKDLSAKYKDFSFVAVHSNSDEPKELTKAYFAAANLPFTVLQDHKTDLADQLKAYKTPHSYILGANGEILYQGGVTNSADASRATAHFLKDALDDLSQGKKIRTAEGRTLGCVISREGENVW